ncbi:uncharacterized protein LOC143449582 [Clavelina lepadiformis]|uniref:uncharacterized protein LOC143449582 n=1 Tax=Clavelina lepadiformis TaxID=159417 RepID=UPI00404249A7
MSSAPALTAEYLIEIVVDDEECISKPVSSSALQANDLFQCKYCDEKFKSQRGFEVHQKVKHRGYLGFSSETCSGKTIKSMWVEVCESPDDLTTEAIDSFMNIFATKPNGSELLTTFSLDGISRILHIFGPNADRCKSLEATRKFLIFFSGKYTQKIQQNCHQVTSLQMKLVLRKPKRNFNLYVTHLYTFCL